MKIFYKTREVKSGLVTSYLKWKIRIWEARVRSTFGPYLKTLLQSVKQQNYKRNEKNIVKVIISKLGKLFSVT